MKKHLLSFYSLILFGLSLNLVAATYIPTPLEDQIKESYGVVKGTYQSKVYKKNRNGDVITEVSIALDEASGLKPGDVINKKNFKITYPGGVWQGIVHKYTGSPEFKMGEEIVLLIHRGDNGFHLLNFGLGKYSLTKEDGAVYLNSSVFPKNPKISGVSYKKFQTMVESKFGQPLTKFKGEKFVYKPTESKKNKLSRNGRMPASVEANREPASSGNNTTMFWLMIVLSILGTSSYKLFNRKG